MRATPERDFVRPLLVLVSGPLVWFAHFSLIYGIAGFGGALGFSPAGIRIFTWFATLVAAAAIVALFFDARRRSGNAGGDTRQTLSLIAQLLDVLAFGAVLLQALVLTLVG